MGAARKYWRRLNTSSSNGCIIDVFHLRKLREILDEAIEYAESINNTSV
jgi:hypothetical protein